MLSGTAAVVEVGLAYSAAGFDCDRWKSSPTRLLCRLSHSSSDAVSGKFTSEIAGFDVCETVEAVPKGGEPEVFEVLPML
jgi:hypothetical protein